MSRRIVNCPHCGKIISPDVWQPESPLVQKPKCPNCGSQRVFKSAHLATKLGRVQRYECKDCAHRFIEH